MQRLYAREPQARGSRIGAAKLVGQLRDGLAKAVRHSGRSGGGNSLTSEGKRHIERGCYGSADDVRADSQPVRGQVGVADPSLQIFWRRNHFRRRQVEEIPTGQQDLRAEEIVACRQNDGASSPWQKSAKVGNAGETPSANTATQ